MHCGGSSCDPSIPKLVYRDSESVPKFEGWLMFTSLYRMSKNIVELECSFVSLLGNVEFEAARSISYFGGRGGLYALWRFVV